MSEPGPEHPLLRISTAYWIHRTKICKTRRTRASLTGLFMEECVKVIHKYRERDWGDVSVGEGACLYICMMPWYTFSLPTTGLADI